MDIQEGLIKKGNPKEDIIGSYSPTGITRNSAVKAARFNKRGR